jgi:spore coat protein CotH
MNSIRKFAIFTIALSSIVCSSGRLGAADSKNATSNKPAAKDDLFSEIRVLRLKIEIPTASLDALKKNPKQYVKATIREGEKVYADAGIRVKGSSSFVSQEKKPSLAVKFNEFTSGRHFHGHSKILLDNGHQDPTFLCDALAGELFRSAGVPAAKVTFAQVELNGQDAGLYVVEQAANHEFLAEFFQKTKGNLYEGAHQDVTDKLEKDAGEAAAEQADLKKLAQAAQEPDPAQRLKKLSAILDLDRFVSFTALEVMTWHHGGYGMGQNNFRIYHDPGKDRLVFIPHSLDHLFSKADGPLMPEWKGLVAKALISVPEGARLYRERVAALSATTFKVETIQARINDLAAKIRPTFASDTARAKTYDAAVEALRNRVAQRVHFLEEELKKTAK